MLSFLIHYFRAGLDGSVQAMPLSVFRLAVAAAVLAKCWSEGRDGAWHWFAPDSFVAFRYRGRRHRIAVTEPAFRAATAAKPVAGLALLAGFGARYAAVLLVVCYAVELRYDRKYHTTFLMLSCAVLAVGDGGAACLTYHTVGDALAHGWAPTLARERTLRGDPFAQILGMELTAGMYFGAAYRKILTPEFMSGAVLYRWVEHTAEIAGAAPPGAGRRPTSPLGRLHRPGFEHGHRMWRLPAVATVALEAALPVALLFPATWPAAALVGLGMHIVFTALYPAKLLPFTLNSVGAYALFLPALSQAWPHLS